MFPREAPVIGCTPAAGELRKEALPRMDMPPRTTARTRVAAILAAVVVLALGLGASSHAQEPAPRDLLPDLTAAVPEHVSLVVSHARAFVGFNSAVVNTGEGPLEVLGTRPSTRQPGMRAQQLVTRSDGTKAAVRTVGALRYVREPRHRYWHLDDVMSYELRTASTFSLVARGSRRGYCLRDAVTFPHRCGLLQANLLSLTMGVGPAQASRYAPISEGQSFNVTSLPSGHYWLVDRVDPHGRFLESDTSDNASSILFTLLNRNVGRSRKVRLTLVGACPGAERCTNPVSFAK